MNPNDIKSDMLLPFDPFLDHLRRHGFCIGVEHHVRLRVLLNRVGADFGPGELKTLLCPLFATNAQQQEFFHRAFDSFHSVFTAKGEGPADTGEVEDPVDAPARLRVVRRWPYLAPGGIALFLAVGVLIWKTPGLWKREPPPIVPSSQAAARNPPLATAPNSQTQVPTQVNRISARVTQIPPPVSRGLAWYSSQRIALGWTALLGPLIIWLAYEFYRLRRRRFLIRKAQGKTPPYSWPIRTELAPDIYAPEDLAAVSRLLHRRYQGEAERLDVPGTVEASIAAMGFPTLRYRKDSRLPEYLFLIDRASFRDHQAYLYEHLAATLREQGLYVSTFFYEGDPRVCWNSAGDESLTLEQLQRVSAGHRLLLFGEGEQLLDAVSGHLAHWYRVFHTWPERALLTPQPPSQWGLGEVTLAAQFAIVPATLDGLAMLAAYFEVPSSLDSRVLGDGQVAVGLERASIIVSLRRYLGDDTFQWLCACALYPELQWDLTLRIGALPSMARGLICEQNLVKLLRLKWFRSGSMPDDLRRELIAQLQPSLQREVRESIIGLLESNPPPRDTFAASVHQFQIAYQRYWAKPKDRRVRRELKAALESLSPDELAQDYAYLDAAESVSNSPLQLLLPDRLRKLLYPMGTTWFGMRTGVRLGLVVAVVAGSLQTLRMLDHRVQMQMSSYTSRLSKGMEPSIKESDRKSPPPLGQIAKVPTTVPVLIQTTPPDAIVTINGEKQSGTANLSSATTYDIAVSRPGYVTYHELGKRAAASWRFTLNPEPLKLTLATSAKAGKILIDNNEKADLQGGAPQDLELPADGAQHTVTVQGATGPVLSFTVVTKPGEVPLISDLKPKDLIAVSSLQSNLVVYTGGSGLKANLGGQAPQQIPADGLRLSLTNAADNSIVFDNKDVPKISVDTGNAPSVYIGLNVDQEIAYLRFQSNVETAHLKVDGVERKPVKPGTWRPLGLKPGTHSISVTADGYESHEQQIELAKGSITPISVQLKPIVVVTTANLVIEKGTPGATVYVDGAATKPLDASGAATIELQAGQHRISFRKQDYENSPRSLARLPPARRSVWQTTRRNSRKSKQQRHFPAPRKIASWLNSAV